MRHFLKFALVTLLGITTISCDREDEKIEEITEIRTADYKLNILGKNNYELQYWYSNKSIIDMEQDENLQKVKKIGDYAFYEKKNLKKITLPKGLETIGRGAFQFCKLDSVVIPDSVSEIEGYAFDTNGLKSVVLSKNLKIIGERAFAQNNISQITIPSSVEYIGDFVLGNLGSVSIIMEGTTPPRISFRPFNNTSSHTIYVPKEALNAYKSSWSIYSRQIVSIN